MVGLLYHLPLQVGILLCGQLREDICSCISGVVKLVFHCRLIAARNRGCKVLGLTLLLRSLVLGCGVLNVEFGRVEDQLPEHAAQQGKGQSMEQLADIGIGKQIYPKYRGYTAYDNQCRNSFGSRFLERR